MYNKVREIIEPLYQVGGSVRDELLEMPIKDYDFCTPLTPDEIEQKIRQAGKHPYIVGKRFGTIGMKIDGQLVEITTFRNEVYSLGSRKPQVEFVKDITADLSRRDFTVNAMAKRDGRIIDPFGGKLDLLSRIIKCVNNPKERFKEDALRMLRAARFASQLEFDIDPNLEGTTKNMNHRILFISRERWNMEMDKLLLTDKPSVGLDFLARTRLLNFMFPELSLQVGFNQDSPHHDFDLWTHTKKVVDNSQKSIEIRWAALLHDIAKPFVKVKKKEYSNYIKHDLLGKELVIKVADYLKWSNDRKEEVSELVLHHLDQDSPLKKADNMSKVELS